MNSIIKFPWNLLVIRLKILQKNCLSHGFFNNSNFGFVWKSEVPNLKMYGNVPKAMTAFWEDQQKLTAGLFWLQFSFLLSHLTNFSMCGNTFPYLVITLETVITLKKENIENFIPYSKCRLKNEDTVPINLLFLWRRKDF